MKTAIAFLFLLAGLGFAQDEEKTWSDQAQLSGVFTNGNSESSNLGIDNTLTWKSAPNSIIFKVSALRVENTTFSRRAVGSSDNFDLLETSDSEVTAERYLIDLDYNRDMSGNFNWYSGVAWLKDEPAGIDSRIRISAGFGYQVIKKDSHDLKVSFGAEWIDESPVFSSGSDDESFPALDLGLVQKVVVSPTTTYDQTLNLTPSLEDSDNYLAVWSHGLSVKMTEMIALKVGLTFNYDNQPAFTQVDLFNNVGDATPSGSVLAPLDELDTTFTTSLVINF